MTREEALRNLNLQPDADSESIEQAYQRLVRRYPPEFHPDKFRTTDESYRLLTSLPGMIEKLLAPTVDDKKIDPALLTFDPRIPDSRLDEAIKEIRAIALSEALWKTPGTAKGPTAP